MGLFDSFKKKSQNSLSSGHFNYVFFVRTCNGKNRLDDENWWRALVKLLKKQIPGAIPIPSKAWDDEPYISPLLDVNISHLKNSVENPMNMAMIRQSDCKKCEDALSKRTDSPHLLEAPRIMLKAISNYLFYHLYEEDMPADLPLTEVERIIYRNPVYRASIEKIKREGKTYAFKNATFNYVPFADDDGSFSSDVIGIHIKQ
jgi:hypothetical protein